MKETRSLGKEQSVPRRKVTQPSVGISLNSWETHPPPACVLQGAGREGCVCVLMCVNVCVCLGGGGPEL